MNALSEYIRKGDLSAPFARNQTVERAQKQGQRLHDYVQEVVAKTPPPSPATRDQIVEVLGPVADRPEPSTMRWRLRSFLRGTSLSGGRR